MDFENWWDTVISALEQPTSVRDWTALQGYLGGDFTALAFRVLRAEIQDELTNGHPFAEPNNWIVCTPLEGDRWKLASKPEFAARFLRWPSYRDQHILRADWVAGQNTTPYVISIFKHFDHLI